MATEGTPVPFEFNSDDELWAELTKLTPKDPAMRQAIFYAMIRFRRDEKILEEIAEALLDSKRKPTRLSELKREDIAPPRWKRLLWAYAGMDVPCVISDDTMSSLVWVVKALQLNYYSLDDHKLVVSVEVYLSRSGRWYVLRRCGEEVSLTYTEWQNTRKLKRLIRQQTPKLSNLEVEAENGIVFTDLSSSLLEIYAQLVHLQEEADELREKRLEEGKYLTALHKSILGSFRH